METKIILKKVEQLGDAPNSRTAYRELRLLFGDELGGIRKCTSILELIAELRDYQVDDSYITAVFRIFDELKSEYQRCGIQGLKDIQEYVDRYDVVLRRMHRDAINKLDGIKRKRQKRVPKPKRRDKEPFRKRGGVRFRGSRYTLRD